MTVGEMLDRISSRELSEWMAYEDKNGPLGHLYADEVLAEIGELIQVNSRVVGASAGGKKNPAPEVQKIPRSSEMWSKVDDQGKGKGDQ